MNTGEWVWTGGVYTHEGQIPYQNSGPIQSDDDDSLEAPSHVNNQRGRAGKLKCPYCRQCKKKVFSIKVETDC